MNDPALPEDPAMKEMLRLSQQETAKVAAAAASQAGETVLPASASAFEDPERVVSLGKENDPQPLSPDELQALREMLVRNATGRRDYYELPDKPVTHDDRARFFESVGDRKAYAETMVIIKEKLEVTFRCKTRREVEMIERQLQLDLEDSLIKNERHFATAKVNYNLMTQMVAVNGAECSNPSAMSSRPDFNLRKHIDSHIICTMPEPVMFMLAGALAQFEKRVDTIAKECLEANFIRPAAL